MWNSEIKREEEKLIGEELQINDNTDEVSSHWYEFSEYSICVYEGERERDRQKGEKESLKTQEKCIS
jgi:hypothetical protein